MTVVLHDRCCISAHKGRRCRLHVRLRRQLDRVCVVGKLGHEHGHDASQQNGVEYLGGAHPWIEESLLLVYID